MSKDRLIRVEKIIKEMAARQQYHDEAFDRTDAAIRANTARIAHLTIRVAKLAATMERLDHIQGEA